MSAASTQEVVVAFSKLKIILLALPEFAFVVFGAYCVVEPYGSAHFPSWFVRLFGVVSVAYFGSLLLFGIARFFDRMPGLIINRQGFIDRTNYLRMGRINWTDVRGLRTTRTGLLKLVVVELGNPQQVVERGNAYG
jgi:hypothetical protein